MGIENKQVVVYSCDACGKRTVVDDGGIPKTGFVGNVQIGIDTDGEPVLEPFYAHGPGCIRRAVEAAAAADVAPKPAPEPAPEPEGKVAKS